MNLHDLAAAYLAAKEAESEWTARRRELATAIQQVIGHNEEGQRTYECDGFKIAIKAPLIRSMDWKAWEAVKGQIPEVLHPIKIKEELDEKGLKWIIANDPQTSGLVLPCITTKPGAVSVTVTAMEGE
jgi:hypothetical protein